MDKQQQDYLLHMRKQGADDATIKKTLAKSGWLPQEIEQLFAAVDTGALLPPPPPHLTSAHTSGEGQQRPIAVVQRSTTVGMEYSIMFLALLFGSLSLGAVLHNELDRLFNAYAYSANIFAIVTACVTIPIFIGLFSRLKKMEHTNEFIRSDSSRRKGVQIALIVSFVWGLGSVIFYLYQLFSNQSGIDSYSSYMPANNGLVQFMHLVISLVIAGSIFAYYWIDEHKHPQ